MPKRKAKTGLSLGRRILNIGAGVGVGAGAAGAIGGGGYLIGHERATNRLTGEFKEHQKAQNVAINEFANAMKERKQQMAQHAFRTGQQHGAQAFAHHLQQQIGSQQ